MPVSNRKMPTVTAVVRTSPESQRYGRGELDEEEEEEKRAAGRC